jgi:hypothetical protein
LPLATGLALAGYFGPWVDHAAAGLVITGLDLGEYVKFLPDVQSGVVAIWRPGFYAPLVAVGAVCVLAAFRRSFTYPWWARAALLTIALMAALNLLPPAWTPRRMLLAEFRWQASALLLLFAGVLFSPFLGLGPDRVAAIVVTLLSAIGIVAPSLGFLAVLPNIERLYRHPIAPGWGLWLAWIGLALMTASFWLATHPVLEPPPSARSERSEKD